MAAANDSTRAVAAPGTARPAPATLPLSDCQMAVMLAFGLSFGEFTGNGRALRAARARHCFCWLAGITTTAEPKEIGRRINRGRNAVSYGADFVNRYAGAAALRAEILARLDVDQPCAGELVGFGRRLEDLTKPTDMEG